MAIKYRAARASSAFDAEHVEFSFDVTEDEIGPRRHDGDITTWWRQKVHRPRSRQKAAVSSLSSMLRLGTRSMCWTILPTRCLAASNCPEQQSRRRGQPARKLGPASAISPDSSDRDQRLDQQRFRPLGKVVVGNLDRIADIDNVGN
jgi:DNA-binding transcriptional LysR family regulator